MVEIETEYLGNLKTSSTHIPSSSVITTDAPKDNEGEGSLFSPTDLVAAALTSCISTVLGIYAKKKGWDFTGLRVRVEKTMSRETPRRIASLPIVVWMPIQLSDSEQATVERIALSCPVHQSLHPDVSAPILFHWPESNGKGPSIQECTSSK